MDRISINVIVSKKWQPKISSQRNKNYVDILRFFVKNKVNRYFKILTNQKRA